MSIKHTLVSLQEAILDLDRDASNLGQNASAKDRVEYRVYNEKVRVLGEKLDKLVNIAAKQELREHGLLQRADAEIEHRPVASEFGRKLHDFVEHIRKIGVAEKKVREIADHYQQHRGEFEAFYADFAHRRDLSIPFSAFGVEVKA